MSVRLLRTGLLMAASSLALTTAAYAQAGYGVRAGVSADPDGFFVGGHIDSPRLGTMGHLTVRPNVEIGFGSNSTKAVAGNLEVVEWAAFPGTDWSLYFGAGPSVVFVHNDFESRAHGGFNGLVGFQNSGGLFVELKVGISAAGNLKAIVGYSLKTVNPTASITRSLKER